MLPRPAVRPPAWFVSRLRRRSRHHEGRRLRWTRAGLGYFAVWLGVLGTGLYQQRNLILLTAGLAAGPLVASFIMSAGMLRRLRVSRRQPEYVFAGQLLTLDYVLDNERLTTAALAVEVQDELVPLDRKVPGATRIRPRPVFERVGPRSRGRLRWIIDSPSRGKYVGTSIELVTRSPFGLIERRRSVPQPGHILVYPAVGRLTRRWQVLHREATETRRGRRHDRTAQQQEYHGLRDYRSGDSPRWIHWRTSARTGQLMVKEFEQENDQELALLIDPWQPRNRVGSEHREALERALQFAATVCLETCRRAGSRLLLGWTGLTPGIRQGPATVRLLHELLEILTLMRGCEEGHLTALFDALPPATLREAMVVVVSTRAIQVADEAARSTRLSEASMRGLASRLLVLDASRGDLDAYIEFGFRPLAVESHGNRRDGRSAGPQSATLKT